MNTSITPGGFPGAQSVKNLPTGFAGDAGNGNPLQYSCLENPMDRGTRQVTVHGAARVGGDLATKPPPPSITPKSFLLIPPLNRF